MRFYHPTITAIALASLLLCAAIPAAFGTQPQPQPPQQEDSQPSRGDGRRN